MKNRILLLCVIVVVLLTVQCLAVFGEDHQSDRKESVPPDAKIHWAKGEGPASGPAAAKAAGTSPNLIWHGGNIMSTAQVQAIFWGPSWGNANFTRDKINGIDTFY